MSNLLSIFFLLTQLRKCFPPILQPADKSSCGLKELTEYFVATWTNFYVMVEKEVMLVNGKSFGECKNIIYIVLCKMINITTFDVKNS